MHHDGFLKHFPILQENYKERSRFAGAGLLYCQADAKDGGRIRQTRAESQGLLAARGAEWPVATIGLSQQDAIEEKLRDRKDDPGTDPFYFPVTVLLDETGAPLVSRKGSLLDWQLDLMLEHFEKTLGATPPPAPDSGKSAESAPEDAEQPETPEKEPSGDDPTAAVTSEEGEKGAETLGKEATEKEAAEKEAAEKEAAEKEAAEKEAAEKEAAEKEAAEKEAAEKEAAEKEAAEKEAAEKEAEALGEKRGF